MLLGKYKHTLDTKGRVKIPARFSDDLKDTFMLTTGLDDCLALYSMDEWKGLEEKIRNLPMAQSRSIQRYLFSNAYPVETDGQGRIVIPADLRDFADLKKDVVIVGVSTRAEIWDLEKWESNEKKTSPEDIVNMMTTLGF